MSSNTSEATSGVLGGGVGGIGAVEAVGGAEASFLLHARVLIGPGPVLGAARGLLSLTLMSSNTSGVTSGVLGGGVGGIAAVEAVGGAETRFLLDARVLIGLGSVLGATLKPSMLPTC